ncbi:MAG: hypothetical protein DWQ04_15710 [Chloroflexi bacterium]|nr:MAG: hypothetical protein DWQ04_15710 [Chloroflexota bacterium]
MIPNRINVKFFVENDESLDLMAVGAVFHRWIQTAAVPGRLLDVADYKHVPQGPGILLVGNDGDYGLDLGNGRSGLLYTHKREWPGDGLHERLRLTWQRALQATVLLADEPALALDFRADEVEIAFVDRLHLPNTDEVLTAVYDEIVSLLRELTGDESVSIARSEGDVRRPFTLHVSIPSSPTLADLLANVVAVPI